MKNFAHLWKVTFFATNVFFAMLLIVTCFFSYQTTQIIPLFSVLSLVVPILFLANFLFFLYWLFKRNKKFLLSLFALLVGYLVFGSFYQIGGDIGEARSSDLKVLTYNVRGFNKYDWIADADIDDRIIKLIEKEAPDILCIQEHSRIKHKKLSQYPYRSETPNSVPRAIQAIFSKYPIVNHGSLELPDTTNNIIFADVEYQGDTIRIYNFHLQSFSIDPSTETFAEGESEKNYQRLVNTFSKQLDQAKIFVEHWNKSPYGNIVCGDMNNTQFSNVYRILKGKLQDTFLEKGKGFGRTYNLLGFPIRIDYILTDADFEVVSHENFNEKLSDHYPVMATLRLKSE